MLSTVVLILTSLAGFINSAEWSHQDEGAWPGKCQVGIEQSPIDIVTGDALPDLHDAHIRGPLVYRGYSDVAVTARNTGYKVRWAVIPGSPAPVLSGGPLRGNYTFAEVHFHWLSEHAINGIKFPMEIHMVHIKYGLSFAQALEQPDGVAVIGVLGQVGTVGSSNALSQLIPTVPYILRKTNEDSSTFNIDLTTMLSPTPQAYYTYHGSLTTPLCPEVVTWLVMEKPITVAHEHYKNLTRADLNGVNNDRAVQPLGHRLLYRSKDVPSCSTALSPSNFNSLAALISCLATKMSATVLGSFCSILNLKRRLFGKAVKECEK